MKLSKLLILLLVIYTATRIVSITKLPVFADEAIYIRWAQMMYDDPGQFTFLPLYDGKTPLFIWLLIPLVNNPQVDPLFMGRMLSTICGMWLLYSIWLIVKEVGGSKQAQLISGLLVIVLPFTFIYNRMALIDTLLTAWLGFSFWSFLRARRLQYSLKWLLIAGLFWGLGLLTKTSGFYYLPVVMGIAAVDIFKNKQLRKPKILLSLGGALFTGLILIGWMRISPLFPFLFQRSSDFAFSIPEIMGHLPHILELNVSRIGKWLLIYLTPFWLLMFLLNVPDKVKQSLYLLVAALGLFLLPFLVTGKLLSSRYFLPVVVWIIPIMALILDLWRQKNRLVFWGIVTGIAILSLRFIWPSYFDPNEIPFAHEDEVQYLTEWSAGYGIPEVRDYLKSRAINNKVYVATEGFFGKLPDGLSIYFHHSPLTNNLEIHGIGQPISDVSPELREKTKTHEVYLVVNQHRFTVDLKDPRIEIIGMYPRPKQAPALLLLRIR
jgi:4-amino-4-deoxy-L-arabinose transferase-like glycosyltransferase